MHLDQDNLNQEYINMTNKATILTAKVSEAIALLFLKYQILMSKVIEYQKINPHLNVFRVYVNIQAKSIPNKKQ